jgi:transcriptional regulator with XRE-family HTH domain
MPVTTTFTTKIISPDIVRNWREKLGLTQAQLASKARASEAELAGYEANALHDIRVLDKIGSSLERLGAIFSKPI